MNKFTTRIIAAAVAASMIATPAFAGRFGGGSSSFRSSGSSFSSSRSFSSGSSFRSSSSSSYRPAQTTSRFSNSSSSYAYRPAQTRVVQRPVYSGGSNYGGGYNGAVNNHYYGGGGYGHSFTSSPFFWMWLMDRNQQPQQVPVYVNGGQQAQAAPQGDPGQYAAAAQDNGPGFFSMIFYGLLNLVILILVIAALVWVVIRIRKLIKDRK